MNCARSSETTCIVMFTPQSTYICRVHFALHFRTLVMSIILVIFIFRLSRSVSILYSSSSGLHIVEVIFTRCEQRDVEYSNILVLHYLKHLISNYTNGSKLTHSLDFVSNDAK